MDAGATGNLIVATKRRFENPVHAILWFNGPRQRLMSERIADPGVRLRPNICQRMPCCDGSDGSDQESGGDDKTYFQVERWASQSWKVRFCARGTFALEVRAGFRPWRRYVVVQ